MADDTNTAVIHQASPEVAAAAKARIEADHLIKKPAGPVLVSVTFTKTWRRWYTGDRAGFAPDVAAQLIAAGVAKDSRSLVERVVAAVTPTKAAEPKEEPAVSFLKGGKRGR